MKKITSLAVLALLTACSSCGRPVDLPESAGALRPGPSVYALMGDREELQLTSTQIAALDSIGEWVTRANSPLEEQLRELGVSPFAFAGRGRGRLPEEAQPLLDQLRSNNEQASAGVGEQLTAEQKAAVCEIRRPSNPNRRQPARR